jgi:hypothetical protein
MEVDIPPAAVSKEDPDAFLDCWATLNMEMDEDVKVHWAETVDKPRYRQFKISGELWAIWLKNKRSVWTILLNTLLLVDRQVWPIGGKRGKFGHGTHSGFIARPRARLWPSYDISPTLGCQTLTQLLWHIQDDVPLEKRRHR